VLGAFLGRKTLSATNISKASTAVRGMGRAYEQSSDVGRAEENHLQRPGQIDGLNTDLQSEIAALDVTYNPQAEKLDTVTIKPKRTGIQVKLVALTWVAKVALSTRASWCWACACTHPARKHSGTVSGHSTGLRPSTLASSCPLPRA
jgi:hypothetical protein